MAIVGVGLESRSAAGWSHTVAIVIPAYNEERFIGKCLAASIRQTSPPDEIIVVDNRSTDGTASIVRRYQEQNPHIDIRLLHQTEHQGVIPTRNYGFDNARSDVIARIDADAIPPHDWVETVRSRFEDPGLDAVSGPVFYYDMPFPALGLVFERMVRRTLYRSGKDQRFLYGANMAIRASAWQAIRHLTQLDPEDRLHEDIDLAITLFKNGFEVGYDPALVGGLSCRRAECTVRDAYWYITRYIRTTKLHGVRSNVALIAMSVLALVYFPLRIMRFFFDGENHQLTLSKLCAELRGKRDGLPRPRSRAIPSGERLPVVASDVPARRPAAVAGHRLVA
ncbi:glycosyltransferase [Mycobacterium ostraviense]|uniref:glycosyltransferase n=1 Tax=Mycobacterium ostraviense TaxID=2738409 RepID=UPI0009E57234|nr:glycosyltransferase family 2 protein [Mycobacterium ostraviense]UGT89633.1 glycosyltransferase [Mycobacterium ostraviense]